MTPATPNLFVMGAPKCGTTALSHMLAGHPLIFMTESAGLKEPNHFNTDLALSHIRVKARDADTYRELFKNTQSHVRYVGEASSLYLYSAVAAARIRQAYPDARAIVMLRDPIDLAMALHNQHAKHGVETPRFEKAWALQASRSRGENLPHGFTDGVILQYGQIARQGEQLARLLRVFPRNDVLVLLLEDISESPIRESRRIAEWLQIDSDGFPPVVALNRRANYKVPWLKVALGVVDRSRRRLGIPGGIGISARIDALNLTKRQPPLRDRLREELTKYFHDDVRLLESLIGRDLSHWMRG